MAKNSHAILDIGKDLYISTKPGICYVKIKIIAAKLIVASKLQNHENVCILQINKILNAWYSAAPEEQEW